jgi:mono/diheme cytochrome c family protein
MRLKIITTLWIAAMLSIAAAAIPPRNSNSPAASPTVSKTQDAEAMRLEGEKRFRANCGRCHVAPQKFPPRMMATIVRHMRVRATITDEDMRLVLYYMTQ